MCINTKQLSYPEQLEMHEWKSRRREILKRDHYCCSFCGKGESERICFDNTYYVGIEIFAPKLLYSNISIQESGIVLKDLIKRWNSNRIKIGKYHQSNHVGLLTEDGRFLYTLWTDDKYKEFDLKTEGKVAILLCDDGYIAHIVYIHEEDLI